MNDAMATSSIGEALREARRQAKLSQNQLAKSSGVSQSTISRIEDGRQQPSIGTLRRLADALQLPVQDLMP